MKYCCENPADTIVSFSEVICSCAAQLNFDICLEPYKKYPRDYVHLGRVRVKLFNDDGTPIFEDIPNRKQLYKRVALLVPHYRLHLDRPVDKKPSSPKVKANLSVASTAASLSGNRGGKAGKSSKKKKGKK